MQNLLCLLTALVVFSKLVSADEPPLRVEITPDSLRFEWLPWQKAADRCFSPSNAEAILQLPRFV